MADKSVGTHGERNGRKSDQARHASRARVT